MELWILICIEMNMDTESYTDVIRKLYKEHLKEFEDEYFVAEETRVEKNMYAFFAKRELHGYFVSTKLPNPPSRDKGDVLYRRMEKYHRQLLTEQCCD